MTPEQAEHAIRDLLRSETSGMILSNKLFTPDGLFRHLASTREEREALVKSPLFRAAQDRVHFLLEHERRAIVEAAARLAHSESVAPQETSVPSAKQ